jgi:hypothetical protein
MFEAAIVFFAICGQVVPAVVVAEWSRNGPPLGRLVAAAATVAGLSVLWTGFLTQFGLTSRESWLFQRVVMLTVGGATAGAFVAATPGPFASPSQSAWAGSLKAGIVGFLIGGGIAEGANWLRPLWPIFRSHVARGL